MPLVLILIGRCDIYPRRHKNHFRGMGRSGKVVTRHKSAWKQRFYTVGKEDKTSGKRPLSLQRLFWNMGNSALKLRRYLICGLYFRSSGSQRCLPLTTKALHSKENDISAGHLAGQTMSWPMYFFLLIWQSIYLMAEGGQASTGL